MVTALSSLDESVAEGDRYLPTMLSDIFYYLKRVSGYLGVDVTPATTTTMLLSAVQSGDLVARFAIRADGTIAMGTAPLTVSTVSGTSTVTVTTTADHGYGTSDVVVISGVAGFVGANGTWTITRTSSTQFTLNGASGSGSYTSGGTVQRILGTSGSANEGVWNCVVPEGETTRYGLVVRLNSSSSKAGLKVVDHQAADIFFVNPSGGCGLISAAAADAISAAAGTATSQRKFAATAASGTVRLAAGDPGGGAGVLAVGNATTEPTSSPDGTHNAETSYTTSAGVVLWARGGRPRARTSAGHEEELLAPAHRRVMTVAAPGGGTTLVTDGTAAPTVATTNVTAAAADAAAGPGVSYTTTAASDVDTGVVSAFGIVQAQWAPYLFARLATDAAAITSTRLWVALTSAGLGGLAADPTTEHLVGFRYDTGLDGTAFWRAVTCGGTSATVTATTAAIAANTSYDLAVEINSAGTSARFWVDGVLVATHATNLPAAATALGYTIRMRTLAASARAITIRRLMVSAK